MISGEAREIIISKIEFQNNIRIFEIHDQELLDYVLENFDGISEFEEEYGIEFYD